jgi:serine/threonine protein kinase
MLDIASALQHMNTKGFVHRDLKSANICLDTRSDGTVVAIIGDFGESRRLQPSEKLYDYVGTERYMARK